MKSINKVILVGSVSKEPMIVKYDDDERIRKMVFKMNVLNDYNGHLDTYKANVVVFGNIANNVYKDIKVGYSVLVEGKLKTTVCPTNQLVVTDIIATYVTSMMDSYDERRINIKNALKKEADKKDD